MTGKRDRLLEYANIGAGHAANALAALFDCVVLMDPPRCRRVRLGEIAGSVFGAEEWIAAIFADLRGPVRGQVGLLLERDVVAEVLRRMLGREPREELDEIEVSALAELGNIALSAAAEALGGLYGALVLPSVPRVGYDMAGALLVEAVHPRLADLPVYLVDAELTERVGALRVRFVWIPEP